ncbi:MAG: GAF domain-containing protein, partial [Desulfobacterota bacterium]|nr:GAF domain-containing protein [Thermodesulfobacteriota bacterium]
MKALLKFEALLSDLSARFVNLPPEAVDREIKSALKAILDFFRVDRAGLVRVMPEKKSFQVTHAVYSDQVPPVPVGVELSIAIHPWAHEKLIGKREVVAFSRIDDLPPEAEVDRKIWAEWGIRSEVDIPLLVGEPFGHIISINSVTQERVWPAELFPRLQLLGEIFVNALERKRSQLELEERLQFERFISDLSARFVCIAADGVGDEITSWLQRVTEFFRVDRASLGLFSADGNRLDLAFEYHMDGVEPAPAAITREQAPWYLKQLTQEEPIVLERLGDLPADAEKEKHIFRTRNMKSLLSIPMSSGKKILGSFVLVSTRSERAWPGALVQRFRLITAVFA